MKNEIIHGKIIVGEDIIEYEEEYRVPQGFIFFGLRSQIFVNCVFKDIENLFEYMVGCTFKGCVFKDVAFDSLWFTDDCKNSFEDCMFFNCETGDFDPVDKINLPESTNMKCPRYDKIIANHNNSKYLLATLEIPAGVKRSSAIGNKCRCEYAKVLSIVDCDGVAYDYGYSAECTSDKKILYIVGEYVYADSFDENRFNECAPGIHFFMTSEEAWDYVK
jgi:hypothetical protein